MELCRTPAAETKEQTGQDLVFLDESTSRTTKSPVDTINSGGLGCHSPLYSGSGNDRSWASQSGHCPKIHHIKFSKRASSASYRIKIRLGVQESISCLEGGTRGGFFFHNIKHTYSFRMTLRTGMESSDISLHESLYWIWTSLCEPGNRGRYGDGLQAGRLGFDFRQGQEIFTTFTASTRTLKAQLASYPMGNGDFFSGVKAAVVWSRPPASIQYRY
jgi:hypothetical protein